MTIKIFGYSSGFHITILVQIEMIQAGTQENLSTGFLTRAHTNWPVQSQKMARDLKFRI